MTTRARAADRPPGGSAVLARSPQPVRWLAAVVQTSRPRQWPKNLLVFAAPLAAASLGRDDGLGYALVAAVVFTVAAAAVYFVNDVVDADRDRLHPVKRTRAVASGRLPRTHAMVLAVLGMLAAEAACLWIGEPTLGVLVGVYVAFSLMYTFVLKHIPVVELAFVAAGFVLRALGGASATRVPPSGWFLVVCSLGALLVAIAKRYTELALLGPDAAIHRPVMRWYTPGAAAAEPARRRRGHDRRLPAVGLRAAWRVDPHPAPAQRGAAGRGPAAVRLADRVPAGQAGRGPDRQGQADDRAAS